LIETKLFKKGMSRKKSFIFYDRLFSCRASRPSHSLEFRDAGRLQFIQAVVLQKRVDEQACAEGIREAQAADVALDPGSRNLPLHYSTFPTQNDRVPDLPFHFEKHFSR
jgi:hypothetical protein